MLPLTLILIVVSVITNAAAQLNVTVEDDDPSIIYSFGWHKTDHTDLDAGGDHQLAEDPAASATFSFTGIAIYFMSPLWPYPVTTQLQLDDQPPVLLDLQDKSSPPSPQSSGLETVASTVVWKADNLPNAAHNLRISVGPNQQYAIVDRIIITIIDPNSSVPPSLPPTALATTPQFTIPSSTASSATTPSPSPTAPSPPSTASAASTASTTEALDGNASSTNGSTASSNVLPIALGAALGAVGVFIVALALWLCCRKRKNPNSKSEAWTVGGRSSSPQLTIPPPQGPSSTNPLHSQYAYHSLGSSRYQQQQPDGSDPSLNMRYGDPRYPVPVAISPPPIVNVQPNAAYYDDDQAGDYNPYVGVVGSQIPGSSQQQLYQHQDPFAQYPSVNSATRYTPAVLPTTNTAVPTPATFGEPRSRLGPSSTQVPSANMGYYPPSHGKGSSIRLSYASDAPGWTDQEQQSYYPVGGSRQPWSSGASSNTTGTSGAGGGSAGVAGVYASKLAQENNRLSVVNRGVDESGELQPPAYTPR